MPGCCASPAGSRLWRLVKRSRRKQNDDFANRAPAFPGRPDAGHEVLIVSGMPLLEEAYRFAELVLPHLPVNRPVETGVTSAFTKYRDAAWKKIEPVPVV